MKKIILIVLITIASITVNAQTNPSDFEGIFSYKDDNLEIKLELKRFQFIEEQPENKIVLFFGNTFIKIDNKILIDQKNTLKSKIAFDELITDFNNDISYRFNHDEGYCFLIFNKAKQIFTLKKLNNSQYILEYSETITNNFINNPNIGYFRNIVPEYELPKRSFILTKQRK